MKHHCSKKNPPSVLIVDPSQSKEIHSLLEGDGFMIQSVANHADVMSVFTNMNPDMVLMNVLESDSEPFNMCASLRKLPHSDFIPIMMLIDSEDTDSMDRGYEAGVTDIIMKPVNLNLLRHKVRYMMRSGLKMHDLQNNEALLNKAQSIARLGYWEWCIDHNHFNCSSETLQILGISPDEFEGTHEAYLELIHPEDRKSVQNTLEEALTTHEPVSIEHRIVSRDGMEHVFYQQAEILKDSEGTAVSIIGTLQNITERKRSEEQIRYLAYYDNLTNLPNRTFFKEHLNQALKDAARQERTMGVLFLDLDYFKRINDTFGHTVGDQLLRDVADRLTNCVRTNDIVARPLDDEIAPSISRLGGDEFTFLLTEINNIQDAAKVARRIIDALSKPFMLENVEAYISASIGIALAPFDGQDVDTLLKNADTAMYHAKSQGRNNYQFYTKSMNAMSFERLTLENNLRKALERDELVLYYQPILNIHTHQIISMEALLRWKHPEMGLVSPAEFIPLAEETGLIIPIGEWVLRKACEQNKTWQDAGYNELRVSVNLSHRQFEQPDLAKNITQAIHDSGLDPSFLELELTESTTMQNVESTIATLEKLKDLRIGLSIDDFGTGYSSLNCLKRFPLDVLKVDRTFVKDITDNLDQVAIIRAIVSMARSLSLKVVAEGVETVEQLDFLRSLGCDEVQGFLFSPPVPPEEFILLLQKKTPLFTR